MMIFRKQKQNDNNTTVVIDDIFERTINGKTYQQVAFWQSNGRYCVLVNKDAVLPSVGGTIPISKFQKFVVPLDSIK